MSFLDQLFGTNSEGPDPLAERLEVTPPPRPRWTDSAPRVEETPRPEAGRVTQVTAEGPDPRTPRRGTPKKPQTTPLAELTPEDRQLLYPDLPEDAVCMRCEATKPITQFALNPIFRRRNGGHDLFCLECRKDQIVQARLKREERLPASEGPKKPQFTPPVMEGEKLCTACRQHKPVGEFYAWRYGKDGRLSQCKSCRAIRARAEKLGIIPTLAHYLGEEPLPENGSLVNEAYWLEQELDRLRLQMSVLEDRLRQLQQEAEGT